MKTITIDIAQNGYVTHAVHMVGQAPAIRVHSTREELLAYLGSNIPAKIYNPPVVTKNPSE